MNNESFSSEKSCILLHNEGIKEINKTIKESETRYSMSKYNENNNDSTKWNFYCNQIIKYTQWKDKSIRISCINCNICGGYISRSVGEYIVPDPDRLIKNIYCDIFEHHNIVNKKNDILVIRKLLKVFEITKCTSFYIMLLLDHLW